MTDRMNLVELMELIRAYGAKCYLAGTVGILHTPEEEELFARIEYQMRMRDEPTAGWGSAENVGDG